MDLKHFLSNTFWVGWINFLEAFKKNKLDNIRLSAYNVRMNTINTKLTTSGNSVAVRLPKELLKMSGLTDNVTLEAREGKIIISKHSNPRKDWNQNIKMMVEKYGDPSEEFTEMNGSLIDDGLDEWDGISYEEWLKDNDRIS